MRIRNLKLPPPQRLKVRAENRLYYISLFSAYVASVADSIVNRGVNRGGFLR